MVLSQGSFYSRFEGRQIILNRIPDRFRINAVVTVPKPITYAANVSPRNLRTESFPGVFHAHSCFADD
jgi:hypothetical protein